MQHANGLPPVAEALWRAWTLIAYNAKRYAGYGPYYTTAEDLLQEFVLEFLRCYPSWDGRHLFTFTRFVCGHAAERVYARERRFRRLRLRPLLTNRRETGRRDPPCPTEQAERRVLPTVIRNRMAAMAPRHREVLTRLFGLGGTEPVARRDLAREYGVDERTVGRIKRNALARLAGAARA